MSDDMDVERVPMDLAAYGTRIRGGTCFVCGIVSGDPEHAGEPIVYEDDAHVHWHVAPLPPGTPFERQQFHALMLENGVIPWSAAQAAELATKLRSALRGG